MKKLSLMLLTIAAAFLAGCSSSPKVDADYNEAYNFSAIKSYYLIPDNSKDNLGQPGHSLTDQRIAAAIKNEMKKRNIPAVSKDQADIWVSFFVTSKDKTRVRSYNTGYNYGYYGGYRYGGINMGYGNDVSVQQYVEGQLMIDLVDPKTNNVVWRGTAVKKIDKDWTNAERTELVNVHVAATMAQIPNL